MRIRVESMIKRSVAGWWLGTFHSIAARILRTNAELVSLNPTFTIIDSDDQIRLIKQILSVENIDAVIKIIKNSDNVDVAKKALLSKKWKIS